jgi:Uma2 family endonuclease
MAIAAKRPEATIDDALARPDSDRIELIRGTLVEKAAPTSEHSSTQVHLDRRVGDRFDRRPGGRWPGGWWIRAEIDIQLGKELFQPDLAGRRRDRLPEGPKGRPVRQSPDWICEVLSPSNESSRSIGGRRRATCSRSAPKRGRRFAPSRLTPSSCASTSSLARTLKTTRARLRRRG